MSGEISDMSFWALEVPPGGSRCVYEIEQQPDSMQIVHVTNAALPGPKFSAGPHCLTIKKSGQGSTDFTLCTLNADMHPQHSLDFIIDETVEFRNHGKGPVHLAGYETTTGPVGEMESDDDDMAQPSSDAQASESESEEEEEEEAPQGVPLPQANGPAQLKERKARQAAQANGMGPQQMSEDDDDESDDEDYQGGELGSEEDEGESGDEESEEEEGGEGESDEDEEDEGESEEDDEGQQQLQAQVGSKRGAPSPAAPAKGKQQQQQQPMTPAPKKAKQEQPKQAPNSAPAKQQQPQQQKQQQSPAKAAPKNEQEYQTAIVNYLRSQPNKTAPLAKVGSAVPRPAGVQKLGPWTKSKPDLFKLDNNNQNLTLVK